MENIDLVCVCRLCGTNSKDNHDLPHAFAAYAEPTPDNQYTTFENIDGFNIADVFAACAEPTPDNQYTAFKPTLRLCFSFRLFDLMPPALTGYRVFFVVNPRRSPVLSVQPGWSEVFQGETQAEASTSLRLL